MTTAMKPPYDSELGVMLEKISIPPILTLDILPAVRAEQDAMWTADAALADEPFTHEEHGIPGRLVLSVFQPQRRNVPWERPVHGRPCILWIHGGGMLLRNRFMSVKVPLAWAKTCGATVVSVEYRVAPEHPAPAAVEDCYAALCWLRDAGDARKLGIDQERVLVAGISAGGGLAAGVALMARDRALAGGPKICGLVLMCPMLDDRVDAAVAKLFGGPESPIWSTESNEVAWKAVLGEAYGSDAVSPYVAPARADDLSGLPPTYIDVASVELFREDCVRYANRLWRAGNRATLHVWEGGFHGFDVLAPTAALSKLSSSTRAAWVRRVLGEGIDIGV
ncbi:alpha/beta hydrolase domain protein [Hypoxylon trugodes]|uniref:alpha/beta hydrolase domain protein n=1 Tax=Hypoxylon trugodes TaxID=326681 RepID=UPI0021999701|nr:alpha/beta hydrolase domain protein [Hypoxylon trugodes]KAI1382536.1 alpha/beta hydrolase domain protein [Hypoxylon trugodes]